MHKTYGHSNLCIFPRTSNYKLKFDSYNPNRKIIKTCFTIKIFFCYAKSHYPVNKTKYRSDLGKIERKIDRINRIKTTKHHKGTPSVLNLYRNFGPQTTPRKEDLFPF